MLEQLEIKVDHLERFRRRQEGHARAALVALADELERRFGVAVAEAHEMLLAIPPDGELEPFAERIDDADADAVEAPGDLIGVVIARVLEFSAGVELSHDDLGGRHTLFGVDAGRNAPAVIVDAD